MFEFVSSVHYGAQTVSHTLAKHFKRREVNQSSPNRQDAISVSKAVLLHFPN